jgi:hypothetical protein
VAFNLVLNIVRRQLGPVAWGRAFDRLLAVRGVQSGSGARNDQSTSLTVSEVAEELGVPASTARRRRQLARDLEDRPDLGDRVDAG